MSVGLHHVLGASALTVALILTGGSPATAAQGIRDLRSSEKRAFFDSVGWSGPLKCYLVGVAESNARWALAGASGKCGATSGHSAVYKRTARGEWKYLFYDMENDGCDRFKMPASVRSDFAPYVC